jgi:hypothetical protein
MQTCCGVCMVGFVIRVVWLFVKSGVVFYDIAMFFFFWVS